MGGSWCCGCKCDRERAVVHPRAHAGCIGVCARTPMHPARCSGCRLNRSGAQMHPHAAPRPSRRVIAAPAVPRGLQIPRGGRFPKLALSAVLWSSTMRVGDAALLGTRVLTVADRWREGWVHHDGRRTSVRSVTRDERPDLAGIHTAGVQPARPRRRRALVAAVRRRATVPVGLLGRAVGVHAGVNWWRTRTLLGSAGVEQHVRLPV